MRRWIPATVVALAVIGLLSVLAARGLSSTISSTTKPTAPVSPSPSLHSKEAVIAAIAHYYDAEFRARQTGDLTAIRALTVDEGSPAYLNLKEYVSEQLQLGKRSVTVADHFADWDINISGDRAIAVFTFWARGHDISVTTGQPLESDMTTPKGHYKASLRLVGGEWLLFQRDLLTA
jgi:hypothetical protein